jgi:hypothetical protein
MQYGLENRGYGPYFYAMKQPAIYILHGEFIPLKIALPDADIPFAQAYFPGLQRRRDHRIGWSISAFHFG